MEEVGDARNKYLTNLPTNGRFFLERTTMTERRNPHMHMTLATGETVPVTFYTNTLTTQIGGRLPFRAAEEQATRLREALRYQIAHPRLDLDTNDRIKFGEKRHKMIEKMDREADTPPPNLTLKYFVPSIDTMDRL